MLMERSIIKSVLIERDRRSISLDLNQNLTSANGMGKMSFKELGQDRLLKNPNKTLLIVIPCPTSF